MKTDLDSLPNDLESLKKIIAQQNETIAYLEEKFRLAQHKQFGKSTEGYPGQGELFNEVEELAVDPEIDAAEAEKESITYERKRPVRKPLPKELPREVITHDLTDEDKSCDDCGHELHRMGEDKSEQLEFIPAQVKVIEHVRPKYSCRHCEQSSIKVGIKQVPVPASPIPKSFATPSLLSQIITSKYQYGLPLYRQENLFKEYGIPLSRQTMSSWLIRCANLLKPLYDKLHQHLLQQKVIQADETTLKVIESDKAKCYMWLYCTGTDSPENNYSDIPNIVLYDFHESRASQCAIDFLQGHSGYLQVDGYQGYESTQATLAGCWAHARRKFKEADIAQGKGKPKAGKATWAISHIKKLYRIEALIKDKSPAEKQAYRLEHTTPLLEEYKAWLDKSILQVPPKSALGKALAYSLNQWPKLTRYLEDGQLNIDNNRAERAIKPFVIGRKNWLFSNTATGAHASSILYSIVETAKANNLVPFDYLHHVLKVLSEPQDVESLNELLPWNVSLPVS
jgi:transposase